MGIVDEMMKQVGVSKEQAEGGLGLIFKLAKDKLGADFSQVSNVVPDANTLIGKAPPCGSGRRRRSDGDARRNGQ